MKPDVIFKQSTKVKSTEGIPTQLHAPFPTGEVEPHVVASAAASSEIKAMLRVSMLRLIPTNSSIFYNIILYYTTLIIYTFITAIILYYITKHYITLY